MTKHSVMRHKSGEGHSLALACEKSKPKEERLPAITTANTTNQKLYILCTIIFKKERDVLYVDYAANFIYGSLCLHGG